MIFWHKFNKPHRDVSKFSAEMSFDFYPQVNDNSNADVFTPFFYLKKKKKTSDRFCVGIVSHCRDTFRSMY